MDDRMSEIQREIIELIDEANARGDRLGGAIDRMFKKDKKRRAA
jgi:hypothetical protein